MDPMYWLGNGGPFASAVLPGVMLIVFLETGLLFPFLPGDTLLFTAGLLAAQPNAPVDIWTLAPCAAAAAIVGGQVGYLIGRRLGPALFKKEDARFFKKHYLTSSHEFFERHGRKTIVIGHFIGVVRSFTPLIAGASGMRYPVFLAYDVIGAVGWGVGLVVVGYHLGGDSVRRRAPRTHGAGHRVSVDIAGRGLGRAGTARTAGRRVDRRARGVRRTHGGADARQVVSPPTMGVSIPIMTACSGFLLAVLWMDLMFDVQVLPHRRAVDVLFQQCLSSPRCPACRPRAIVALCCPRMSSLVLGRG